MIGERSIEDTPSGQRQNAASWLMPLTFTNSTWWDVICPDKSNSNSNGASPFSCQGH